MDEVSKISYSGNMSNKYIIVFCFLLCVFFNIKFIQAEDDIWYMQDLVDDFGDVVETVWQYNTQGTFSNSATIDSELRAFVRYRPDEKCKITFVLYEYGSYNAHLSEAVVKIKIDGDVVSQELNYGCLREETGNLLGKADNLLLDFIRNTNDMIPIRINEYYSKYALTIKGVKDITAQSELTTSN